MWFWGTVARPGRIVHSDGPAGTSASEGASGCAPAEQRVEEGVRRMGHQDHEEGHRLQESGNSYGNNPQTEAAKEKCA